MSDADYEYECSRAELLGVAKPSKEEFLARKHEATNLENETEDVATEEIEGIDLQGEGLNRTAGGLDELNNILSITQKKINRFKTVCGSFTNLLKLKVGVQKEGDSSETTSQQSVNLDEGNSDAKEQLNGGSVEPKKTVPMSSVQKDVQAQVGSQIDKLDSMILKAERAELSLSSQNKQMKHFLNK